MKRDIPFIVGVTLLAILFLMLTAHYAARAQSGLPGGVTCERIVEYAAMMGIPNTAWGRTRARIIAATLGMRLTNAQLEAAAQCLKTASAK